MRRGSGSGSALGFLVCLAVSVAIGTSLVGEREALAQESHVYGERRPATESRWYGWQIILVDAATIGISLAAQDGHVAAVGYLGAAPLVHLAHLEPGHAGLSLALRAVAPLAGAALGYGLLSGVDCNERSSTGCAAWFGATAVGAISGLLAASVIDAALLSSEDVPIERDHARESHARRVRILPSAAPTNGGAMAGFTGTF